MAVAVEDAVEVNGCVVGHPCNSEEGGIAGEVYVIFKAEIGLGERLTLLSGDFRKLVHVFLSLDKVRRCLCTLAVKGFGSELNHMIVEVGGIVLNHQGIGGIFAVEFQCS